MKLTMDSGNFSLTINGDLKTEKHDELLGKGMKYEVERGVLSKVYKDIAGVDGKRDGTVVLPKGFERTSVAFNEDNAKAFKAALDKALEDLGAFETTITQYVPPESESGVKKATALYEAAKSQNKLKELAAHSTINYEGDVDDADAFIAHIHAVKYAKVDPNAELAKLGLTE